MHLHSYTCRHIHTHTHNFSVRSSRNSLNISYVPRVVLRIQRNLSHSFPSLEESDAVGRAEEHPQSGNAIPEPAATQAGRRWARGLRVIESEESLFLLPSYQG